MSGWTNQDPAERKELQRYTPRDLTDSKDFTQELHSIDNNQTLTLLDKYRYKKQLMRSGSLTPRKSPTPSSRRERCSPTSCRKSSTAR